MLQGQYKCCFDSNIFPKAHGYHTGNCRAGIQLILLQKLTGYVSLGAINMVKYVAKYFLSGKNVT